MRKAPSRAATPRKLTRFLVGFFFMNLMLLKGWFFENGPFLFFLNPSKKECRWRRPAGPPWFVFRELHRRLFFWRPRFFFPPRRRFSERQELRFELRLEPPFFRNAPGRQAPDDAMEKDANPKAASAKA